MTLEHKQDITNVVIRGKIRNLNNFDLVRFIAVIFVIFAHSYILLGIGKSAPQFGNIDLGEFGVMILFILSGYLIAQSWDNNPEIFQFYWKRILRIVPGLIGVIIFGMFVIGPLVTTLNLKEYFVDSNTYQYLRNITIFLQHYRLPGVFTTNPYTSYTNGSLWTLIYEFTFYIIFSILGITGLLYKKKFLIITILCAFLGHFYSSLNQDFSWSIQIFNLYIFFFSGVIYYFYRDSIKYSYKIQILFLILLFILAYTPFFYYSFFLLLPYILLYFAFLPNKIINNFGKHGDFSYGMYLYAFPIQQTLIFFFYDISIILLIILSIFLSFIFGFLSWRLIESKLLELKKINIKNLNSRKIKIFFCIFIIILSFYLCFFFLYYYILFYKYIWYPFFKS